MINNVDRMLETVGGEQVVSRTYGDPSRRLELRFRPRDPFCHSLCGNRVASTSFLLRVRKRVRKGNPKDAQINMDILGVIGTTYKFQGMADFQYLAVHSDQGKQTSLYNTIILRQSENQEYFEQDLPYFLPPAIFSRLDNPVDYCYRPDSYNRYGFSQPGFSRENLIGLNRARRPHNAIFITFDEAQVPCEPLEAARVNWDRICQKPSDQKAEEDMKKLFENRPIWSRNAVKANVDIHPEKLKLLLPVVAFYMLTGPWRSLWVRLGYDPRQFPEAKMYQVLDFRIRCSTKKHGYSVNDIPVRAKRSTLNYTLPIILNKTAPEPANVMQLSQSPSSSKTPQYQLKESSYKFREGTLPPYRQMFYQLCDLDVEKIRKVIQRNEGKEEECDERDGWCPAGTSDDLRDIMSTMIKQTIRAQRPAEKSPQRPKRSTASRRRAPESDEEDEEDEDEDEEYQPSEGSDNEMETEILDYL